MSSPTPRRSPKSRQIPRIFKTHYGPLFKDPRTLGDIQRHPIWDSRTCSASLTSHDPASWGSLFYLRLRSSMLMEKLWTICRGDILHIEKTLDIDDLAWYGLTLSLLSRILPRGLATLLQLRLSDIESIRISWDVLVISALAKPHLAHAFSSNGSKIEDPTCTSSCDQATGDTVTLRVRDSATRIQHGMYAPKQG